LKGEKQKEPKFQVGDRLERRARTERSFIPGADPCISKWTSPEPKPLAGIRLPLSPCGSGSETLVSSKDQGRYDRHLPEAEIQIRRTLMETLQQIMYAFYAVLMLIAAGIAMWFYKKKKENDR
jgi:hypothetical protein